MIDWRLDLYRDAMRGAGANTALLDTRGLAPCGRTLTGGRSRDAVVPLLQGFSEGVCARGRKQAAASRAAGDDLRKVLCIDRKTS